MIPARGDGGVADAGAGAHYASPEAHDEAAAERRAQPAAPDVISMAGIPLQQAPCLPPGSVHVAVTGTAMHWIADSGASRRRVGLPGLPGPCRRGRALAWRVAAERQWQRLLELRAVELAPGGRFIAALPASPEPCPDRTGLYVEIIGDMNRMLADWHRAGRIGAATVAAIVVPVWMRTLDEIRAPFEAGGGHVDGLELESAELFRHDNPYWDDDPAVFARDYVRSVLAWGGPLLPRSRVRARTASRAPRRLPAHARGARRRRPRPLSLGLRRGPRHLPEGRPCLIPAAGSRCPGEADGDRLGYTGSRSRG